MQRSVRHDWPLGQELKKCYGKIFELKARAQGLSGELSGLKKAVESTELRIRDTDAEIQRVELRETVSWPPRQIDAIS